MVAKWTMRQIILLALSLLVAITTWGIAIEPVNSYVVVEHYTGKILARIKS